MKRDSKDYIVATLDFSPDVKNQVVMTVPAFLINLLKRGYKMMSTWQLAGAYLYEQSHVPVVFSLSLLIRGQILIDPSRFWQHVAASALR